MPNHHASSHSPAGGSRGSAVLMAVIALLLFAGLGSTTLAIISTQQATRTTTATMDQAYALAQAGIEYAKHEIDQGDDPSAANVALGTGTFTINTNPDAGLVTAIGTVGDAQKTHSTTTNFGKNCVVLDVAEAVSAGPNIENIKLIKSCLSMPTIVAWTISWTPDLQEKTTLLQIQGDQLYTLYNNPLGYPSGTTIDATDFTMPNNNGVTPVNKWKFDQNLPDGKTFFITIYFKDGSSTSSSFVDN
ncbi:MAG: hypothetical protein HYV02_05515 [Deltaproteobacteria bacterium]|nr:hypothetical protein [Deltaproteobacteria bacterium]